jgi:hypothetical protein
VVGNVATSICFEKRRIDGMQKLFAHQKVCGITALSQGIYMGVLTEQKVIRRYIYIILSSVPIGQFNFRYFRQEAFLHIPSYLIWDKI